MPDKTDDKPDDKDQPKNTPTLDAATGHRVKYSDSLVRDFFCVDCGADDGGMIGGAGGLDQPCPYRGTLARGDTADSIRLTDEQRQDLLTALDRLTCPSPEGYTGTRTQQRARTLRRLLEGTDKLVTITTAKAGPLATGALTATDLTATEAIQQRDDELVRDRKELAALRAFRARIDSAFGGLRAVEQQREVDRVIAERTHPTNQAHPTNPTTGRAARSWTTCPARGCGKLASEMVGVVCHNPMCPLGANQ